jgi:hypothetical protein
MKQILVLIGVLMLSSLSLAQATNEPLADCFGWTLIQVGANVRNAEYILSASSVFAGKKNGIVQVVHSSLEDLDVYEGLTPNLGILRISSSFEPNAQMKGETVYRAYFELNGVKSPVIVCTKF